MFCLAVISSHIRGPKFCWTKSVRVSPPVLVCPPTPRQHHLPHRHQLRLQNLPPRPLQAPPVSARVSSCQEVLPREVRGWGQGLLLRPLLPVPLQGDSGLHMRPGRLGTVSGGELQCTVLRSDNKGGGGSLSAVSGGEHSRLLPRSLWSWVLVLWGASSGQVETVRGVYSEYNNNNYNNHCQQCWWNNHVPESSLKL